MKVVLGVVFIISSVYSRTEQHCSRYHYEEQILAKVVRLEHRLELMEQKVNIQDKTIPGQECKVCPDAWMRYKGSCYLFESTKFTFDDARYHCKALDSDMVHIDDVAENEFIVKNLRKLKEADFWIGLTDIDKEGIFKWVDDNRLPSFTKWHTGQPDNSGKREHCAAFTSSYKYNWNDSTCQLQKQVICEMKAKL